MADFPSLEPDSRAWTGGIYPATAQAAWGMPSIPFTHGATPSGHILRLAFLLRPSSEAAQVRNHRLGQRGDVIPFALPQIVWLGSGSASGPVPAGTLWRYVKDVSETQRVGGLVDFTVELEAVL